MLKLAVAGALALALLFPVPIVAEDAAITPEVVCKETLAGVVEKLKGREAPYQLIPAEKLADVVAAAEAAGVTFEGKVTNAVMAVLDGVLVFGVELDGKCFSDKPIALTFPVKPARLSGKQPDGSIYA